MTAAVDVYGASLTCDRDPLLLRYEDGRERLLPVDVWTAAAVPGDQAMLSRCRGATLDIGCGPGRLTVALGLLGLPALGVDIAPDAVRMARSRGALVLARSVFSELPGRARWGTVLLADGNVGIGGNPVALLTRACELLSRAGRVVLELDPPGTASGPVRVRIEHGDSTSDWFAWAHLAAGHTEVVAESAGLRVVEQWTTSGRWFATLERP